MGRKLGAPPHFGEELGPHLAQCGLGRDHGYKIAMAETYLRAKWHLGPSGRLATIDTGRKLGVLLPFWGRELGPHLTQCRLGRAKWHLDPSSHRDGRKIGGSAHFWGGGAICPHLTQCRLGRGLPPCQLAS